MRQTFVVLSDESGVRATILAGGRGATPAPRGAPYRGRGTGFGRGRGNPEKRGEKRGGDGQGQGYGFGKKTR